MPEITPEQRVDDLARIIAPSAFPDPYVPFTYPQRAAARRLARRIIAAGWGPVTDAEARGYRAGILMVADWIESQRNDIPCCGNEFAPAIRALADKPKEGSDV